MQNCNFRVGHGFDVHQFGGDEPLVIAGIEVPYIHGFIAHSDGDVLLHALCDALLGATALGDIGVHFPDTDPKYKGIDSILLLQNVYKKIQIKGFSIVNIDITLIAQAPKMAPYILEMRKNIVSKLNLNLEQINIKATTTEKLGFIGRAEGIACEVVVLVVGNNNEK